MTSPAAALIEELLPRDPTLELLHLAERWQPATVAILGIGAFRVAFGRPRAVLGPQPETVGGRPVWALPNPSGLNAHHQLADLARLYAALRTA